MRIYFGDATLVAAADLAGHHGVDEILAARDRGSALGLRGGDAGGKRQKSDRHVSDHYIPHAVEG